MKVSFPSGFSSFLRNRVASAVVWPISKLTAALELKKSLVTESLVTYIYVKKFGASLTTLSVVKTSLSINLK